MFRTLCKGIVKHTRSHPMSNIDVPPTYDTEAHQQQLVLPPPIVEIVDEESCDDHDHDHEHEACDECETEFCFDCPNMLEQLPTYNQAKNAEFIQRVKAEIARQQKLKAVLETDDATIEKNMDKLKEFVEKNATNIADQLKEIKGLSGDLKRVFEANQALKEKQAKIAEMHQDEQLQSLAGKIKDIKSAKAEIALFLDQHGVVLSE